MVPANHVPFFRRFICFSASKPQLLIQTTAAMYHPSVMQVCNFFFAPWRGILPGSWLPTAHLTVLQRVCGCSLSHHPVKGKQRKMPRRHILDVILICFTKRISTFQKLFPKFNPMSQTIPGSGKCPTCQTRISAQLKAGEENGQQPVTQQELVFPRPLLDSNACETLSSIRKHRGENACHSIQWKGGVCVHDFHGIQVHSEFSMKLWHQPGSKFMAELKLPSRSLRS